MINTMFKAIKSIKATHTVTAGLVKSGMYAHGITRVQTNVQEEAGRVLVEHFGI